MPEPLDDAVLLLRLRARHARAELVRWFHATGSDLVEDASLPDRLYQLYAAALILGALVVMWLALLDACARAGAALGAAACARAAGLLWTVPLAAFALLLARHLRSCPVRMTHPDISLLSPNLSPASWVLSGLACALPLALTAGASFGFAAGTALAPATEPAATAIALAVSTAATMALSWAVGMARRLAPGWPPRVDMGSVVRANSLYADLQPMRAWAAQAPAAYEEARRRRLVASRRPLLGLPDLQGRRLLVARAALSHVRQREGIPGLLVWGMGVIPVGALVASSLPDIGTTLAWAAGVAAFASSSREMTRVFADDSRVRVVGDVMAFPRFELLLLDSLPAAALVAVPAICTTLAAVSSGPSAANTTAALLVCLSLTAVLLFAGGLDRAERGSYGIGPPYELVVFGYAVLVASLSLVEPAVAAGAGCAYAALLGTICKKRLS